jgi:uncharacterized membrane protein
MFSGDKALVMRYASIDILRTLSIFVMVFVHFTENLAGYTPHVAGLGAPMFMFLSGVSYRLWLLGRTAQSLDDESLTKRTVRRGLFLFGLGFCFNIMVWLPEDVFNWDVLTLIGTGLLALAFLRHWPTSLLLLICGLLFAISPTLRQVVEWETFWTDDYFDPDLTWSDVWQGFLIAGYFPVFPWLMYPLLGYVVGRDVLSCPDEAVRQRRLMRMSGLGVGLMALSAVALTLRLGYPETFPTTWPAPWTMFPPSLEYCVGTVGWTLAALGLTHWLFDQKLSPTAWNPLRKFTERFSRRSLTAYLLHHIVHLWPLWLYAVWQGQEPTFYWRQAMSIPWAVGLAAIFLLACHALFVYADRRRLPAVENLMRWLCD